MKFITKILIGTIIMSVNMVGLRRVLVDNHTKLKLYSIQFNSFSIRSNN
jgi:hypothetical protein